MRACEVGRWLGPGAAVAGAGAAPAGAAEPDGWVAVTALCALVAGAAPGRGEHGDPRPTGEEDGGGDEPPGTGRTDARCSGFQCGDARRGRGARASPGRRGSGVTFVGVCAGRRW